MNQIDVIQRLPLLSKIDNVTIRTKYLISWAPTLNESKLIHSFKKIEAQALNRFLNLYISRGFPGINAQKAAADRRTKFMLL